MTSRLRYSTSRSIASALSLLVVRRRGGCPAEGPGRGADRREGGAQVVRHGLEQRRLQRVALAGDLGGLRLGGETIVRDRLAELVGRRGEEPGLGLVGLARAAVADRPEGAEGLAARLDLDPVGLARRPDRGCRRRLVDANPLRRAARPGNRWSMVSAR